jgi:hypothetical protein
MKSTWHFWMTLVYQEMEMNLSAFSACSTLCGSRGSECQITWVETNVSAFGFPQQQQQQQQQQYIQASGNKISSRV